jgi:hypothetical protein
LIRRAFDTGQGVVSYQVVQEFFNVALRRFSPAMTFAEAEQYLITVFRRSSRPNPPQRSFWKGCE